LHNTTFIGIKCYRQDIIAYYIAVVEIHMCSFRRFWWGFRAGGKVVLTGWWWNTLASASPTT
jgi:hypothetical protein